ncbi:MAG TPA: hypothetical protein VFU56_07850 [Gaiellaceae bacterium]|nr:hypothetical protein [Gaiellaceae bacterium]
MTRPRTIALALLAGALFYSRVVRKRVLARGATSEEAAGRLPGDELLEDADGVATRALTVDAPASAVWPWLVQMGPSPRGGAYTYDWIENVLATRPADGNWVWTFVLDERGRTTRLISRNRFRLPRLRDRLGMIPLEPASLVMERKMLHGIKERAERLAAGEDRC